MVLREIGRDDMDWIDLIDDAVQSWALLNRAMKLQVP
jgi:hypothetical protein